MSLSQRELHTTIEQATSIVVEPFYSVDSKVDAISAVCKIEAPEALSLLKCAFEMISYPLNSKDDSQEAWFKSRERPRGGRLAGVAAKALATYPDGAGSRYLIRKLLDKEADPWIKDCAAYGLAGLTEVDALAALQTALTDTHIGVRLSAVRALDECLSPLSVQEREEILLELFKLACHNHFPESPAASDPSAQLAKQTIRIYRTPKLDLALVSCIAEMNHDDAAKIGAEILGENLSGKGALGLAYLLKAENRSQLEYEIIGKLLKNSDIPEVISMAQEVLTKKSLGNKILSFFLPELRAALKARSQAAKLILGKG